MTPGREADPGQKNHQIRKDAIDKYREEMAALEIVTMSFIPLMKISFICAIEWLLIEK